MISFRYHVVSLLAVLLALAAGIAVGSGPLQRSAAAGSGDADTRALQAAQTRIDELGEGLTFADAYAEATATDVVGDRLDGRAVTVVALPGADESAVSAAADMVRRAGGAVTARVAVGEKLLDVGNRQLVSELATQMHDSVDDRVEVPAGASGYERMSLLVAHAVATTRAEGRPVTDAGDSVLAGAASAELVTTRGDLDRRGSLVMVVAGEPYGTADARDGAGSILATLVTALDADSDGVVVTGPVAAAADDGLVAAVRDDPIAARDVSTVDMADRTAGAVVAVLALAAETEDRSGHYGSTLADDGPVPRARDR